VHWLQPELHPPYSIACEHAQGVHPAAVYGTDVAPQVTRRVVVGSMQRTQHAIRTSAT
jgi:hypothetical protein